MAEALELEEIAEGARVGTAEAGFRAMQEGEVVPVGQGFEGAGKGFDGGWRVVRELFFARDGGGEELGFDEGDTVQPPLGGDHFVDQVKLDRAAGLELLEVGCLEGVELGGVFGGEDEGFRSEAVFEGVLGGAGAAGFGGRAAGFCAVGAGGFGFGWHMGLGGRVADPLALPTWHGS